MWSFAAILPAFATAFEVFEVLGIQRWCDRRQCLLHIAGLEVPRNELTQLQHGDGIVVTILPQQLPIEPDDTSPMQTDRGDTISAVQAQRSTADALDFADATSPVLPGLTALPTPVHMRWQDAVADYFHDEAVIECEEEGSVLYIWTWYIDHQAFRHCPEPKIVRIGSARHEWLEKIYEPWLSLLNPRAVTNVAVVHPIPPHDALRIETLHIMIEQNPLEPRAAAVLSAIFHEAAANRLLQAAYSLPRWLCTEDIIDFLQLNPICEIQRCSARAGRIPFEQFVRHAIPSALSIELHVRPVRCLGDDEAASSAEPFVPRPLLPTTGRSLMQVSRRWQRHRQFQQHDEPPPPQEHLSDEHHDVPNRVSACASHPTPQLPLMAPVWPTPWTALEEVWTFYFANQMQHPDTQITAEVWYSDHLRRPWSDSGRTVALYAMDFPTTECVV